MTVHFEIRHPWPTTWAVFAASVLLMGLRVAQANDAPEQASQGTEIDSVLDNPVGILFEDTHLSDILDFITKTYEINIIVDNRVVRPKDPNVVDPAKEYVTDGVLHYVNLKNVTLREALTAILRPLSLSYSVQRSFIWISAPGKLRHSTFEELETRFYEYSSNEVQNQNADLEGVALEPIDVLNLLRHVVAEIVEPVTKEPISYMRLNEKTHQLVVYNTPANHDLVSKMLRLIDQPIFEFEL